MEKKDLLEYEYEDRKIIRVAENNNSNINVGLEVLRGSSLIFRILTKTKKTPIPIKHIEIRQTHSAIFPNDGLPQIGNIYICNPIDTRRYYEVEKFHEEMINHKIYEAEYFLRSLGSTQIEVTNITEVEKRNEASTSFNDFVKGEFRNTSNNSSKVHWSSSYNPTHEPYIPNDLTWFDHEQQWKTLANARLNNGIQSFELIVEINEDFGITPSLVIPLKSGILKADGEFKKFKKSTFKLAGEFKPILVNEQ